MRLAHIPGAFLIAPGATYSHPSIYRYPRHMLLAQVLARRADFRDKAIEMRYKWFSIMDTGIYEGEPVPDDVYLDLVGRIQPTYVILPDLPDEDGATSLDYSLEMGIKIALKTPHSKFIVCPQGRTIDEVLKAATDITRRCSPDKIVLGMGLARRRWEEPINDSTSEAGRLAMMKAISRIPGLTYFATHILGARWTTERMNYRRLFPKVVGVDSFKPAAMATAQCIYGEDRRQINLSDNKDALPDHVHISPEWIRRLYCGLWNLENLIL